MSYRQNHIIRNTVIDFQYNGNINGFSLQKEVRDWCEELLKELEPEMDKYGPANEIISIDQLNLEVDLNDRGWRNEASNQIITQLKDKLQLIKSRQSSFTSFKKQTVSESFAETLLYYLQHGNLPWQASALKSIEWNRELEQLFDDPVESFIIELKALLAQSSNAFVRYLQLIPVSLSLHLLQPGKRQLPIEKKKMIHDLGNLLRLAAAHYFTALTGAVHQLLLRVFVQPSFQVQIETTIIPLLKEQGKNFPKFIQQVKTQSFKTVEIQQIQILLTKGTQPAEQELPIVPAGKKAAVQEKLDQATKVNGDPNAIYIANAGLVLMATFLPVYFDRNGWVEENEIKDIIAATCATNYLATGSAGMEEFELVLPKILCGVEPATPVSTSSFTVNDQVEKETESLITSVIEYWNILKNTSVDGLRESFLMREGKLIFNRNEWLLTVEQKPYDMLLQHLPWGFSIIKLPWMKQFLRTAWI